MTILTRSIKGKRGRSWVLHRDDRDFSETELETARQLQDLLVLLDNAAQCLTAHRAAPSVRASAAHPSLVGLSRSCSQGKAAEDSSMPSPPSTKRQVLTDREVQVLSLLAEGLTAVAIGRVLDIRPRTVTKHLEHAYAKLGSHDRLLAVRQAAALGLLPNSQFNPTDRGVRS